jgi:hypothetical protein
LKIKNRDNQAAKRPLWPKYKRDGEKKNSCRKEKAGEFPALSLRF